MSLKINGWNGWSILIVSTGLVANWLALLYVLKRVEEMQRTHRISFQYFDRHSGLGRRELISMVEKLERGGEFSVVNYFNRKFETFDADTEHLRDDYFRALQSKLESIRSGCEREQLRGRCLLGALSCGHRPP
jgi:hypothetical protein